MIYVFDTHAVVWYLEQDPKLGAQAAAAFRDGQSLKAISALTLLEIGHMHRRSRTAVLPQTVKRDFQESGNRIVPVTAELLDDLLADLEIHDSIIVATAAHLSRTEADAVTLVSKDKAIWDFAPLPVVW